MWLFCYSITEWNPFYFIPMRMWGASMKRLAVLAALLTSMSGAATAADLFVDSAPVSVDSAAFDWTGFYVGVHGGGGWGSVTSDDTYCMDGGDCDSPNDRYFSEPDLSGWQFGGHVGAAQQLDSVVLGVETDLNWSDVSGTAGFQGYNATDGDSWLDDGPSRTNLSMKWDGSARVKVGLAVDRFLPYATAGIAYGQATLKSHRRYGNLLDPQNDPIRELDFEHSLNLLGYTVGLGAAYAVTDNMVLHAEARYTEYGEQRSTANIPGDSERLLITGPKLFSIRGGASIKF
jgi:outer membrane immunogenic protein